MASGLADVISRRRNDDEVCTALLGSIGTTPGRSFAHGARRLGRVLTVCEDVERLAKLGDADPLFAAMGATPAIAVPFR